MSVLISFDESGKIIGKGVGPQSILEEAAAASDFAILANGVSATEQTHYVEGGALVEKPAQPSDEHVFDYATKQWVYDLTHHRADKWAEIKQARDSDEFGTFTWSTHTFQCDEVSQRRIQGAVQLAQLDSTTTLDWTLADNSVQTFNATELQQIGQALAAHVNACHVKSRTKRGEIDAATTQTELDAITW